MVSSIADDPYVHADIATIRSTIEELTALGISRASCNQALELTASTLEAQGMLACFGGRTHLYGTSLPVVDALQRAQELRALVAC